MPSNVLRDHPLCYQESCSPELLCVLHIRFGRPSGRAGLEVLGTPETVFCPESRAKRTARRGGATMNLPGETEAGCAGRQPCRGITGRAHRADVQQRGKLTLSRCTLATRRSSSDDRPSCLENPRPEGAEPTLTENVASPLHAEPRHKANARANTLVRHLDRKRRGSRYLEHEHEGEPAGM